MKRCPKCQSIYSDEATVLCSEDGTPLENAPSSDERLRDDLPPAAQPDSQRRYKYDVFISYASSDYAPVERLVERLKQDGFSVWFDQEQMAGGNVVLNALAEGLENSAHVIVCLSEAYLKQDYTFYELNLNQSLDPINKYNRTIPVIIGPVSKVPLQISGFARKDLTDPERYEAEYEAITRSIGGAQRSPAPPAANDLALETLRHACKATFKMQNDPSVALFLVQRAAKALGMFLYRRETGQSPSDLTFDALLERLRTLKKLPPDIDIQMMTAQRYGYILINDQVEAISATHESIKPGLEALKVLVRWTFTKYFAYDPSEVEKIWADEALAEPEPSSPQSQLLNDEQKPVTDAPTAQEIIKVEPLEPVPPHPSDFFLRFEIGVESQSAWPLAATRALVWEKPAGTLAVWEDSEVLWRDSSASHLRRVALGPDNRLCVGSWEGRVRCFADGMLAVAADLSGAVGDIEFCAGRWVAGTWKHSLMSITSGDGAVELPPGVANGVLKIAAMKNADWFAVADLRGGIALYREGRRVAAIPPFSATISSMAFAGRRLMVLAGDSLRSVELDGQVGTPERLPATEKASLLPSSSHDCCLLLARHGASWEINKDGILHPYFNLPAGHTLLSHCHVPLRFTVALPQQGCVYWRDGKPQESWPEATTAQLSPDGRFVTIVFPDKVQLYEDPR